MPRPTSIAAPLALVLAVAGHAYEPAMTPEAPPPGRFLVSVEEGSAWGEHRLYLRLFPTGRGPSVRLPFMAGTGSGNSFAAFEVAEPRHHPRGRPAGWAELGLIPEDGTYRIRVSAADAGTRSFTLELGPDRLTLAAARGDGRLEVAVPEAARLPRQAFTFRYDPPHGHANRWAARRIWEASLLATEGVERLARPEAPLSDGEFESWLDEGAPLLLARDPREVYRTFTEMAVESAAHVVVRWYGGLTWDLDDTRWGVLPEPCWLPNLDYLMPAHLRGRSTARR